MKLKPKIGKVPRINKRRNFVCRISVDRKVLVVILAMLGALIIAVALCSCTFKSWELENSTKRPQVVNEKVKCLHNEEELSIGDMLIRAGQEVKHMESRGMQVYKIRLMMRNDMDMNHKIYTVWIYYND